MSRLILCVCVCARACLVRPWFSAVATFNNKMSFFPLDNADVALVNFYADW